MRRITWCTLVVVGLPIGVACSSAKKAAPGQSVKQGAKPAALRVPAEAKAKTYVGYLEIDPLVYGKGVQAVRVHTASGRAIGVAIRYRAEHLRFVNKRVVITGKMARSSDDPRVQSYRYFRVDKIALAPGETPHQTPPTEVPAPPVARSRNDLEGLPGAWRVAYGVASYRYSQKNPKIIEKVSLKLSDGFAIDKHLWRMVTPKRYKSGETATLLVRYNRRAKRYSAHAFCRGEVRRCGVGSGRKR